MRALAYYKIIIDNEKSFITKYHFKNRLRDDSFYHGFKNAFLLNEYRRVCMACKNSRKLYKSIKLTLSIFLEALRGQTVIGAQFGVRRSPESRDKSLNKLIEIFIHSR